jgi:hypothetical protein
LAKIFTERKINSSFLSLIGVFINNKEKYLRMSAKRDFAEAFGDDMDLMIDAPYFPYKMNHS